MELTKDLKKLVTEIESQGWKVEVLEDIGRFEFEISTFSPAGQDFSKCLSADNAEEFIDTLKEAYFDFDVSYEAYMWLGSDGHGQNGAPYDMRDVYDDMEWCWRELNKLWLYLYKLDWDNEEE